MTKKILLLSIAAISAMDMYAGGKKNPNHVRAAKARWAKKHAEDARLRASLETAEKANKALTDKNKQVTEKLAKAKKRTQTLVAEKMRRARQDRANQRALESGLAKPVGKPVTLVDGKDMKLAFKEAQKAAQEARALSPNALVPVVTDVVEQAKQKVAPIAPKVFDRLRNCGLSSSERTILKQPFASNSALVAAEQAKAWRIDALKNSAEAIAKREARAAAKLGAGLGVPTVNGEPSMSFLKSFVEKLPTLEKLAAQEMAHNFKDGQRATEQLLKYYEPAKKAGLIATHRLSTECAKLFGGLAVYGTVVGAGMKAVADHQAAQEAQKIAEEKAAALAGRTFVEKAQDQLRELKNNAIANPKAAIAVAAGTAVATAALTSGGVKAVKALRTKKEEEKQRLTLMEINEQAKNMQHLISLLRSNYYTQDEVQVSDLTTPILNKTSANFVISCLK